MKVFLIVISWWVICIEILPWSEDCRKQNKQKPVAELMCVQHVFALDCSFLLSNSLSLLVEQQQFLSFKLKLALQRLTTLVWFSCYWLKGKGVRVLIVCQNLQSCRCLPWNLWRRDKSAVDEKPISEKPNSSHLSIKLPSGSWNLT